MTAAAMLEHFANEAKVAQAFGYNPTAAVGLLPRQGECLNMRPVCHHKAVKGGTHCTWHGGEKQ